MVQKLEVNDFAVSGWKHDETNDALCPSYLVKCPILQGFWYIIKEPLVCFTLGRKKLLQNSDFEKECFADILLVIIRCA